MSCLAQGSVNQLTTHLRRIFGSDRRDQPGFIGSGLWQSGKDEQMIESDRLGQTVPQYLKDGNFVIHRIVEPRSN